MGERRPPSRGVSPTRLLTPNGVSLHGSPFEAVRRGLLAVDPKDLDGEGSDDGDSS